MGAYKEGKNWKVQAHYKDWQGNRKRKQKRGFRTKGEAKERERDFLQQQTQSVEIEFGNFLELYYKDMEVRLRENTMYTKCRKKSEDTLIQITKDSSYKQRYLKKIIAVLLIAVGVCVIAFGIIVCNKLRQPQNYIEAVDPDSVEMKTAELLSGIDGTMMFRYNSKDTIQTLYVYLSEYQSGKRISHKKVLELSYQNMKSAKNGLIVITPDFDNFTTKLIAADEYSKYMTETPILEGVANREYYGRSATSIENKSTIEYGTEQGLAALIYGEQGVSSLPIQDIRGEYIDTDNEYMYYYSVEFIK